MREFFCLINTSLFERYGVFYFYGSYLVYGLTTKVVLFHFISLEGRYLSGGDCLKCS